MSPLHNQHRAATTLLLVAAVSLGLADQRLRATEEEFFTKQIAPILEQHCLRCHSKKSQRGGLSLARTAIHFPSGE